MSEYDLASTSDLMLWILAAEATSAEVSSEFDEIIGRRSENGRSRTNAKMPK
jgi:hypothetical protein